MKKLWFIPLVAIIAIVLGLWVVFAKPGAAPAVVEPQPDEVHYHAGFQIYLDDQLVDLTDLKYMHLKPCTTEDHAHDEAEDETVHMHNGVPDVIHIHAEGKTWKDVAEYINEMGGLGFTEETLLTSSRSVEAYVNGEKVDDILSYPVKAYDSVVVFIGKATDKETKIANRVTLEHMKEVEASTEGCGLNN
jgi:hypothetical protein